MSRREKRRYLALKNRFSKIHTAVVNYMLDPSQVLESIKIKTENLFCEIIAFSLCDNHNTINKHRLC